MDEVSASSSIHMISSFYMSQHFGEKILGQISSYFLCCDPPQVLDIEFHNVKALYRRAQAYMQVADLVLAELDIKKALEVDPQNR